MYALNGAISHIDATFLGLHTVQFGRKMRVGWISETKRSRRSVRWKKKHGSLFRLKPIQRPKWTCKRQSRNNDAMQQHPARSSTFAMHCNRFSNHTHSASSRYCSIGNTHQKLWLSKTFYLAFNLVIKLIVAYVGARTDEPDYNIHTESAQQPNHSVVRSFVRSFFSSQFLSCCWQLSGFVMQCAGCVTSSTRFSALTRWWWIHLFSLWLWQFAYSLIPPQTQTALDPNSRNLK